MTTTVFDVAGELIQRGGGKLEALKLQKLCFFAFGWYAHLTGEPLFAEKFYAMEKGPVVGELLSAHAKRTMVDLPIIEKHRDSFETMDPYKLAVIDAVWDAYGSRTSFELVELTHDEEVWKRAWGSRRPQSKRGELASEEIVEAFLGKPGGIQQHIALPPAIVSLADLRELDVVAKTAKIHRPFIDAARKFSFAS